MYHITDNGDTVEFHGVDIGGGIKPKRVIRRQGDYLALHIPGHKYWAGNFMPQNYAPASFIVIRKTGDTTAEAVIDFPIRRP